MTAVLEEVYQSLGQGNLQRSSKALYGPACQTLEVLGQFTGELKHQEQVTSQTIFVVQGLKTSLLELPAITALQLLKRVDATHMDGLNIHERLPKLFSGLGNPGEEYMIQLKEGTVPHALYTPRKIPIPLRDKSTGRAASNEECWGDFKH